MSFREWLFYELQNDGYIDDDTDLDIDTYDTEDLLNSTEFEMHYMDDYVMLYREYCDKENIEPDIDLDVTD